MNKLLTYIFYPNPGNASFTSPKALTLIIICALMVLMSFGIKYWRSRLSNPITKKLSRSWARASFWFGVIGLILAYSRIESISYVSMRLWWVVWLVALGAYLFIQYKLFRARHYEVLPKEKTEDPREKYLPKRKKK